MIMGAWLHGVEVTSSIVQNDCNKVENRASNSLVLWRWFWTYDGFSVIRIVKLVVVVFRSVDVD